VWKIRTFLERLPSRVNRESYEKIAIYRSVGCPDCSGTGYRGRIGVYEFLEIGSKSEVEALIFKNPTPVELWEVARRNGIVSMQEDGVLKVITGLTTFDEVVSVTGLIEWPKSGKAT
jgi:type IV pilus assembly protein PilB